MSRMFVAADFSESARSLCDVLKILALEGGESGESRCRMLRIPPNEHLILLEQLGLVRRLLFHLHFYMMIKAFPLFRLDSFFQKYIFRLISVEKPTT